MTARADGRVQLLIGGRHFQLEISPKQDGILLRIDDHELLCAPREIVALAQAFLFVCACADPDYAAQVLRFDDDLTARRDMQ